MQESILRIVATRLQAEKESVQTLNRAKEAIAAWQELARVDADRFDWGRLSGDLRKIITQLEPLYRQKRRSC